MALALAIGLSRFRSGGDLSDEGFLAYGAQRVIGGEIPNRDFFSLQPPLSFYTAAAIFKILGTSLASLRVFGLAIYLTIPVISYAIIRCFVSASNRGAALLGALPNLLFTLSLSNFVPLAVWQGIAATMLAAWLFLLAALRSNRWLAFLAGMATAISALLRHDQAFYFCLAVAAFAVALWFTDRQKAWQIFSWWLFGIVLFSLAPLFYFGHAGALPWMFRQLIAFPLTTYAKTSSIPFPRWHASQALAHQLLISLWFLPPIFYVAAGIWMAQRVLRRGLTREDAMFIFLLAWAALFYAQVLTRSDIYHLLITLPPFWILTTIGWKRLVDFAGNGRLTAAPTVAAIVIPVALAVSFFWTVRPLMLPDVFSTTSLIDLPRGGVRVEVGNAVTQFVRDIQKHAPPERPILSLPYQPMFYFLSERRNPTRWNYLWPGDQTESDHRELIAEARRDPPAIVILFRENEMQSYAPTIVDYVHEDFAHYASAGDFTIYLPR